MPARPDARSLLRPYWPALLMLLALAASPFVARPVLAAEEFLEPDKAFVFSARPLDARTVEVTFDIAPGYYLYREQFRFEAEGGAKIGEAVVPKGKVKYDETFAKNVETYRDVVKIAVPVQSASGDFRLTTTSQGCADAGLCYPPMQSAATVSLTGFGGGGTVLPAVAEGTGPGAARARAAATGAAAQSSGGAIATARAAVNGEGGGTGAIESVLRGGAFWPVVGVFFLAGLLLSLTPCVLPMLPIVSSIIVGQGGYGGPALAGVPAGSGAGAGSGGPAGNVSRGRGFALAAAYSLGMAVVYTLFGIAAGLAGEGLAATLQNPWVLGVFALGLVALSLSMFGVYELRMPTSMACKVTSAAQRLPGGQVAGVCAMGGVSALIVSPCVAAPLAGALLYLSQTGNVWLGGTALFSLAAGMSVPLLLVGASAGALLPRAGPWMVEVKVVFGMLLLGVALWTVSPVLPAQLVLLLWGVLALAFAAAIVVRSRGALGGGMARSTQSAGGRVARNAVAALLGLVGAVQIVGAAAGGTDPLQPLARLTLRGAGEASGEPRFTTIKSSADLDAALRSAGRPVLLDFYADWCVSCKEMDRYTFTDAGVQKKLEGALLLRADVTANDTSDRELLRRFRLFGPPGLIFFDAGGQEIGAARVVGYQKADRFLDTLGRAGL